MTQAQVLDLTPIDSTVEEEAIGFDYGQVLAPGVNLTGTPSVTCTVVRGTDAAATSRLIGSPQIVPSGVTAAPLAQVNQLVGTMIGGVTYLLQCVCATSDGQRLSVWVHLSCRDPS